MTQGVYAALFSLLLGTVVLFFFFSLQMWCELVNAHLDSWGLPFLALYLMLISSFLGSKHCEMFSFPEV